MHNASTTGNREGNDVCCCGQPIINGQFGYRWKPSDTPSIRRPYPPDTGASAVLYDEPGRCGGLDAHCHHYRVTQDHGSTYLHVQHGGGHETVRLSATPNFLAILEGMDSTARYWTLHAIYHAYADGLRRGHSESTEQYKTAFLEGRLKKRKRNHCYRVEVLPRIVREETTA